MLQNEERFKMMDMKAHQKSKMILEYIRNKFEDPIHKEWNMVGLYQEINQVSWPPEVKAISLLSSAHLPKSNSKTNLKKIRLKTEAKGKLIASSSLRKSSKNLQVKTEQK